MSSRVTSAGEQPSEIDDKAHPAYLLDGWTLRTLPATAISSARSASRVETKRWAGADPRA